MGGSILTKDSNKSIIGGLMDSNRQGILKFNLEDFSSRKAFKRACKADDCYLAFYDIFNEIWRPSWKHGYDDKRLNKLASTKEGIELIEILFKKYSEILSWHEIDVDSDLE